MTARRRIQSQDIVCVGFADWDSELWTNQHHLMARLAHENRVLFVESLGLRQPQMARRDLSRMWRRLRRGLAEPRSIDGLHVLSPLVIPAHRYRAIRALNRWLLRRQIRRATQRLAISKPLLWAYVPQAEILVPELEPALIVYHCVDDIAAQPGIDSESFRDAEARFMQKANLVVTSSLPLTERLSEMRKDVLYAPNVADTDLFSTALEPGPGDAGVGALPRPRIVFTGAIVQTKLDFDLLLALARERPAWSIALVGPIGPGDPTTDVSELEAQSNIHLLGYRRHADLPNVLRSADIGLIPYAINQLTKSVFPMKVYEYLAAGLPVVSTPLPALSETSGVAVAPNATGLAALIEAELTHDNPARQHERSLLARAHSWEERLLEIGDAIESARR